MIGSLSMVAWSSLPRLLKASENKLLMALSLLVGLVTGVAAWLFIRILEISQFWPAVPGESHFLGMTLNRFLIVIDSNHRRLALWPCRTIWFFFS